MIFVVCCFFKVIFLMDGNRRKLLGVRRRGILGSRICAGGFGIWLARKSRCVCVCVFQLENFCYVCMLFFYVNYFCSENGNF